MINNFSFHSNGKLLLSGEYFVLDGAKAIGLPCRYGQKLNVRKISEDQIQWESRTHESEIWFRANFHRSDFEIQSTSDPSIAKVLQDILVQAKTLNPDFLAEPGGFACRTSLEFPRLWGLGSSSTLLNNIAQWAAVDPFELSRLTLGGSGYDIACAAANSAIFYRLKSGIPQVETIPFNPDFRHQLYFVYLERKQNSREGIKRYRAAVKNQEVPVEKISSISEAMVEANDLSAFQKLLLMHEHIVSSTLGIPRVQETTFEDFSGVIKSLGAWGGDFILAASAQERSAIKNYFNKKGYKTFLDYEEMVIGKK